MSCKKITSARLYACEKHTITEAETSGATPSWESFCQLCLSKKKRERKRKFTSTEKVIILKRSILVSSSSIFRYRKFYWSRWSRILNCWWFVIFFPLYFTRKGNCVLVICCLCGSTFLQCQISTKAYHRSLVVRSIRFALDSKMQDLDSQQSSLHLPN